MPVVLHSFVIPTLLRLWAVIRSCAPACGIVCLAGCVTLALANLVAQWWSLWGLGQESVTIGLFAVSVSLLMANWLVRTRNHGPAWSCATIAAACLLTNPLFDLSTSLVAWGQAYSPFVAYSLWLVAAILSIAPVSIASLCLAHSIASDTKGNPSSNAPAIPVTSGVWAGAIVALGLLSTGVISLPHEALIWCCSACLTIAALVLSQRQPNTSHEQTGLTATHRVALPVRCAFCLALATLAVGSLCAGQLLLLQMLWPTTTLLAWAIGLGIVAGIGIGSSTSQWIAPRRQLFPWIAGLVSLPAGFAALLGTALTVACFSGLIEVVLNLNTAVLTPAFGIAGRAALTAALFVMHGVSLGCLGRTAELRSTGHLDSSPLCLGFSRNVLMLAMALSGTYAGWTLVSWSGHWLPAIALSSGLLTLASLIQGVTLNWPTTQLSKDSSTTLSPELRLSVPVKTTLSERSGFALHHSSCGLLATALIVIGLSAAAPGRTDLLLFSTESLVAARSGWDHELLPSLTDSRLVNRRAGWGGPISAFHSHGAMQHLRQSGIPRGNWSRDTSIVAQPAGEIVQAVWPILLCESPDRVLIAGLGSGNTARAVAAFPVREVSLISPTLEWTAAVNQLCGNQVTRPWLTDSRFTLKHAPLELAALSQSEPYDVILLPTPQPLLAHSQTLHQPEFYQQFARQLAPGGMACVRLETVDWGLQSLARLCQSFRTAFPQVVLMETGPGEMLLLGTTDPALFQPTDLQSRLERPHVQNLLAACGWDWSVMVNLPAYDGAALDEVCVDLGLSSGSTRNGATAVQTAQDLLRWTGKAQEIGAQLTATRRSEPLYLAPALSSANTEASASESPSNLPAEVHSRKSRLLEWMKSEDSSADLLRRLSELAAHHRLITDYPETYQWEYRKVLRQELQDRPRTAVVQIAALVDSERDWHPEDRLRKAYFQQLGAAAVTEPLTMETLQPLSAYLSTNDPLLSLFAYSELAELVRKAVDRDVVYEARLRLHAIYFSPSTDAGIRQVVGTLDLLANSPTAIADPAERYDLLNNLLQVLRLRWERKGQHDGKSTRITIQEVDRCVMVVERALNAMEVSAAEANISVAEWEVRREVLERLILRPLRSYRGALNDQSRHSKSRLDALLRKQSAAESSENSDTVNEAGAGQSGR